MNENNANFTPDAPNFKTLVRMSFQGLTNFPYIEEDFDALTNYGLLSKVVEYLNEVISNNNEQNTLITNLYNAYVSLQNYVNDYFDNLDVQENINTKLDEMVQDGTLTTILSNYIDPLFNTLSNNVNATITAQNTEIENIRNLVDVATSGSPLVASSVSGMTDTTRVYVNTTDGKWYYYDGDSWEIGGTYQASELANSSIYLKHLNKKIFGNLFKLDGVKNYGTMVFQVSNSNIQNVTSVKVECLIYIKEYHNAPSDASLLIRSYDAYNPTNGSSWSQTDINNQSKKISDFTSGFAKFTTEKTNYNNGKVNAIDIRWNYNSSTTPLEMEWYVKNIRIWINDEEIDNIFMSSSYAAYLAEDISPEKDFIVSNSEYTLNNDVINDKVDEVNTKLNNVPTILESFMNQYDTTSKSSLHTIACFGDSLTAGGSPGVTYPQYLKNLINTSNVNVINRGSGGQCSGTIAFRQGGNELTVVNAFNIPASNLESVQFTVTPSSGNAKNFSNVNDNLPVIINGIKGTMNIISNSPSTNTLACEFTRTEVGSLTSISSGTQVESQQAIYENDLNIIWFGINDVTFAQPYDVSGVVANYQAMVNHLQPTIKRFLVLSTTTTSGMTQGTTGYSHVMSINNALEELYPNNFVDIRKYLVEDCIYDMGITPTAEDIAKMEADTIPPSLLADDTHPNEATREYIAKYIYNNLLLKGWIA